MSDAERRAAFVADLRALADLIERETSLPVPSGMRGTGFASRITDDAAGQVAIVFAAAEILGTPVSHDRSRGVVETTLTIGKVSYGVYASTRLKAVVTVSDPSQVLGIGAVTP
jgi:hypothetical protein